MLVLYGAVGIRAVEWDVHQLAVGIQEFTNLKQKTSSPPASVEPRSAVPSSQEPLMASKNNKSNALLLKVHQLHYPFGPYTIMQYELRTFQNTSEVTVRSL